MNIYLDSIGCRLNQAEIESYARQFVEFGHTLVADPLQADLVVVNTCAVTAAATADSRQKIRRLSQYAGARVVATGCWATLRPREVTSLASGIQVIPNAHKDRLVWDLFEGGENLGAASALQGPTTHEHSTVDSTPTRQLVAGSRLRTRAFIKVQDGCDNRCTFCVTCLARGAGRSRPEQAVLADIRSVLRPEDVGREKELADMEAYPAAREVVLTGVHLGSWGKDLIPPRQFKDLVAAVMQEKSVARLRLSSLEPWDLAPDFFALWQDPRLCRQLHLPLQSGCTTTLQRMARKITPDQFSELAELARRSIPGVAITTDVIVGFPGESEQEFQESLDFVRRQQFADGHVFTYSPRPGTAAARMLQQVPAALRKERRLQMQSVLEESSRAYRASFVGQTLPVLWESHMIERLGGWEVSGLTDNYLRVKAIAPQSLWNQITPVRLTGLTKDGLLGQVVGHEEVEGKNMPVDGPGDRLVEDGDRYG